MKTVTHPSLPWTITHDPVPHTYTDQESRPYTSVTTFVKSFFTPFDEHAALARAADSSHRLEIDIAAEWRAKRDASAAFGTRVHAYAEALILGITPPQPADAAERRAFAIVDKALAALAEQYDFIGAEQIVFDPLLLLAGSIDLPARNRTTGALTVLDWKTCEDITSDSFGRRALPPIESLHDSKVTHHALQLSTYAWLLTAPGWTAYPTEGDPVELACIHIPHVGDEPVWRPMTYEREAVERMVRHHMAATIIRGSNARETHAKEAV